MNALVSFFFLALTAQSVFGFPNLMKIRSNADDYTFQFPYLVSLQPRSDAFDLPLCAGAILDELHILTAAECVYNSAPLNLTICAGYGAGEFFFCGTIEDHVATITIHPDYDTLRPKANVAVLKLEQPLKFADDLQKIDLADKSFVEEAGSVAGTAGSQIATFYNLMKGVNASIVSTEECKKQFPEKEITDDMFCGKPTGDNCASDVFSNCNLFNGTPLVQNEKVIGLTVSYPAETDVDSQSTIKYTRVSEYVDFINSVIQS